MINCDECRHRSFVPGSAHYTCSVFTNPKQLLLNAVVFLSTGVNPAATALGLTISPHGTEKGWANFPLDYDPVWLEGECKGFSERGTSSC
jgi:hypothetical protein